MRAPAVVLASLFLLPLLARGAHAQSDRAWTTLLRPLTYTDLLAEGDTLWAASLEGGLLRYSISGATFEYTVREPGGLVSNRLTSLARDRRRRLYVGSEGHGLSMVSADRRTFTLINAFDGLPSDTVNVLEADGDSVWIGTPSGLGLWNGREIAGRLPDGTTASPFASNDVRGVVRAGDDLWVGTMNGVYRSSIAGGLTTWRADTAGLPRPVPGVQREIPILRLAYDGTTLIALVDVPPNDPANVQNATFWWNAATQRWVRLDFVSDGTRVGSVSGIWDDDGGITGASDLGVLRWDGTRWVNENRDLRSVVCASLPCRFIVVATQRPDGRLVAANGRRFCLEETRGQPWTCALPPGPTGSNVQDVLLDGSRVWVACDNEGIGRFDGAAWRHWFASSPFNDSDTSFRSSAYASGLLVDKLGRKFVGCWNSGFERWTDDLVPAGPAHFTHLWSPATDRCDDVVHAPHTSTTASALDSSGGHWFGLNRPCDRIDSHRLDYYDANGEWVTSYRASLHAEAVNALTVSGSGRVWIGYAGLGVAWFDPPASPGGPISVQRVAGTEFTNVAGLTARGSDVWVLTSGDLRRYRDTGLLHSTYTIRGNPSTSELAHHPVDLGPDGSVWFGTNRGLRRYLPDGTRQDFDATNSPIASEDVRSVRVHPATGIVWVGTSSGMSRYDPSYVPPPPPEAGSLQVTVYPNPVRLTGLGVRLRLTGDASAYRGRILDLGGRRIRDFTVRRNGAIVWDGHDAEGALVRPGLYFVHVEAGGRTAVARVAVVR